ncbi:MAG: polysaccharide biosynthesis/export family protein [Hyphomicrobiaceae bacterium]
MFKFWQSDCVKQFIKKQVVAATAKAIALVILTLCAVGSVAAQSLQYTFDSGDTISVFISGQETLSQDFVIDVRGQVTIPLIGRVDVRGLTAPEVEKVISGVIAEKELLNEPTVTVGVKAYRPIYILGDVKNPGAYPFTSYATVQTAIALAGGRGLVNQGTVEDYLTANQAVRDLEQEKIVLKIRLARLEAQRDGKSSFEVQLPKPTLSKAVIDKLIEQEKIIFVTQTRNLEQQQKVLTKQNKHVTRQIAAVGVQEKLEEKQLALIKKQLNRFAEMSRKGIARSTVGFALSRDETERKVLGMRLQEKRAALNAQMVDSEMRMKQMKSDFVALVLTQLQVTRDRLRKVETALPTARAMRKHQLRKTGSGGSYETPTSITINRTSNGLVDTLVGNMQTRLEPGDHVEIKLLADLADQVPGAVATKKETRFRSATVANR